MFLNVLKIYRILTTNKFKDRRINNQPPKLLKNRELLDKKYKGQKNRKNRRTKGKNFKNNKVNRKGNKENNNSSVL